MFYVYILASQSNPGRFYVGCSCDLKRRLAQHNRGDSKHTAKYRPWRLVNYIAFLSKEKAEAFEEYLKSGAGRRFQQRHFGE
ncbi:GIY-YIG nuclease family protein [bacterium]|nr:GIY-YIG nuclease family protein [bacterium]